MSNPKSKNNQYQNEEEENESGYIDPNGNHWESEADYRTFVRKQEQDNKRAKSDFFKSSL